MRLDLHVHTVASDGAWTPEKVVLGAATGGLDVIAITDHDTTAGVRPAQEAAESLSLQVVAGTELSSTLEGRELHFLGYFVEPESTALTEHHVRARDLRRDRMARMVDRLRGEGLAVTMDAVLEAAGDGASTLARPHLARAMVDAGLVGSVPEAFDRYLSDKHPAFIPTALQDPFEAVSVVLASGGVPVWAHPPLDLVDRLLPSLVEAGLRGLEVYRPWTSSHAEARLRAAAATSGLVLSGGSDWHNPERNEPLGAFFVTERDVQPLLSAGGI